MSFRLSRFGSGGSLGLEAKRPRPPPAPLNNEAFPDQHLAPLAPLDMTLHKRTSQTGLEEITEVNHSGECFTSNSLDVNHM